MTVTESIRVRPAAEKRPPQVSSSGSQRWKLWALVGALVLVGTAVLVWVMLRARTADEIPLNSEFKQVVRRDLDIKIRKKGELAAVNNIDVFSQVEGQTTIQWVIPEGTTVTKGKPVVILDSSALKQKLEDSTLDLQKAEADVTAATEMKDIQESQNAANLEAAQVSLKLAKIDLLQYTEGSYPQQLKTAQIEVEMAQTQLKNKEEDLDQTRRLSAKGFVTQADVKKGELDVLTSKNDLDKKQTALLVLEKYTHQMDLASKENAVAQADQKLARTQNENASNLKQKLSDVQAKTQAQVIMKRRVDRYSEQLAACTINAPEDGVVVYASSIPEFRWRGNPIMDGSQIRERQMLVRLPDVREMKAIVRIPEAQVSKLEKGMRAKVQIVGMNRTIDATVDRIAPVADSSNQQTAPDVREFPVDLILDETPPGHKPGESADSDILLERITNVLAVPLSTIYVTGTDTYVFVKKANKLVPTKIKTGSVTEEYIEVKEGVSEGEDILQLAAGQARGLLEKAGVKVEPASRPVQVDSGTTRRSMTQPSSSPTSQRRPRRPKNPDGSGPRPPE